MPTTTPNLGLTLPTPNVDTGWGSTLNTDFTTIDNVFGASGAGPSVGLNVGPGKTLNVGGTLVGSGIVILGSGDGTGTTAAPVIRGTARTGTNVIGPNLVIDAANGTGNQGSGDIVFRTAPPGAAGSTLGTMTNALSISSNGYTYSKTALAYNNDTILATTAQVYSTITTVPQNYKTATAYTLALVDAGTILLMDNVSPITITIPNSSSVSFPTGSRIDIFQSGAGQVTFSAAAGVTRLSSGGRTKLSGQYSAATLIYNGSNTWFLIGDLTT